MRALRPRAIARRLVVVVPLGLLAAGVTFALGVTLALGGSPASTSAPARVVAAAPPALRIVVVPDLRQQAYVFARGILLDGGFAWAVDGGVQGYPSNIVVKQTPAPGTHLVDTGAPTIRLQLAPNPQAPEAGDTVPGSPYSGTEVLTPAAAAAAARKQAAEAKRQERAAARAAAASTAAETRKAATAAKAVPARVAGAAKKARAARKAGAKQSAAAKKAISPKQALAPKSAAKSAPKTAAAPKRRAAPSQRGPAAPSPRPAAFAVAGAPREPVKEMPLPDRARLLARWIAGRPPLTAANRHHFLYQHAWVVTGARFGWWHGGEALAVLVAADRQLERQWRLAAAARAEAEAALADVRRRSAG